MKLFLAALMIFGNVMIAHAGPAKAKRGTASLEGMQGSENLSATPGHNTRVSCQLSCPANMGQGTEAMSAANCSCIPGTVKVDNNACPSGKTLTYAPSQYNDEGGQNFNVWSCR